MEFRDLKQQYEELKFDIDRSVKEVMQDANFIMGRQVSQLENELAEYVGTKHCITCANGTDALQLALMSWGIGLGDAVFVPDFTFFSSGEVVDLQGATPIFVDVNDKTFNIDVKKLEKKIIEVLEEGKLRPRVIIAVDLFGLPADYEEIRILAEKYKLLILEDGAQGFGGMIYGKRACSFGDIATTSFFPAKPLGCYGDGGAIFTDNDELADLLASYKIHGKGNGKYDNVRVGMNSRLDTLQAAVLLVKLKAFKEYELQRMNDLARLYETELKNYVMTPTIPLGYTSSWAQYTIILHNTEEREKLQSYLEKQAIPSMVYYRKPMHRQKAFSKYHYQEEEFTVTNRLCDTVLSLPIHPYMKEDEIQSVADCIKGFEGFVQRSTML
ncbi:DegT/DnrJ/EryC1/StrS family aminotransferase [Anaerostipes sp.]|uniref:DegT/DnrJ/EryC1/StrS family aminotransferase n=1 Tax=Anaerostipes sp. TaxID=1872530 RepID=UPI0025C2FD5A|nr:DegT/DnrJ/EryC1/StrS family aminotransferase [Anaerostipes sp.]MBS7007127.1 DegT/DnrJ/EryC1/StrS family aminotransferase [Anaerostipes sp.]